MEYDSDDDAFVTIGTPFEVPEDQTPLKKQAKVSDQIVVDKQGRRRFHGAFTGGFSAGYFNTVGSKEGWTPATFVSSRKKKQEQNLTQQRPEDFMDDDDFSEHGIAPRKLQTTDLFKSTENELESRKRHIKRQMVENEEESTIPVTDLLIDELIFPSDVSIGIQILKKMGWKPGQGVGEKTKVVEHPNQQGKEKKVYGCMRPPAASASGEMDMNSFQKLLAPKDVVQVSFERKDNFHGIGYSGLDPTSAIFGGLNESTSFKPTGREKKGIKGQGFGVGAFEDDDDDIYGVDSLSNYDISMSKEDDSFNHGWSGGPKNELKKGCLQGFAKGSKVLKAPSSHKMIALPAGFIPKHTFNDEQQTLGNKRNDESGTDQQQQQKQQQKRLSSKERSLMFGETVKTLDDVNKWALKWDKPVEEGGKEGGKEDADKNDKEDNEEKQKTSRFSTRWDKEINQVRPKGVPVTDTPTTTSSKGEDNNTKKSDSMYDVKSKMFRPFARFPEKQARYEEFVAAKKANREPVYIYDTSVTEWERQREKDEFSRASVLYRPLNSLFADRFTPATSKSDPQNISTATGILKTSKEQQTTSDSPSDSVDVALKGKQANVDNEDADEMPSDMKAAKMGMHGKLTRTIHEWHPDKLLCKRFNIPDPYPSSRERGVPGRGRKSKSSSFFERDFLSIASSSTVQQNERTTEKDEEIDDNEEDEFSSRLKNNNSKEFASASQKNKKSMKIGPLSHLNRNFGEIDKESSGAEQVVVTSTTTSQQQSGLNNNIFGGINNKPTIDIFKAIFDDSESSGSSSSDGEDGKEDELDRQQNQTNVDVNDNTTNIAFDGGDVGRLDDTTNKGGDKNNGIGGKKDTLDVNSGIHNPSNSKIIQDINTSSKIQGTTQCGVNADDVVSISITSATPEANVYRPKQEGPLAFLHHKAPSFDCQQQKSLETHKNKEHSDIEDKRTRYDDKRTRGGVVESGGLVGGFSSSSDNLNKISHELHRSGRSELHRSGRSRERRRNSISLSDGDGDGDGGGDEWTEKSATRDYSNNTKRRGRDDDKRNRRTKSPSPSSDREERTKRNKSKKSRHADSHHKKKNKKKKHHKKHSNSDKSSKKKSNRDYHSSSGGESETDKESGKKIELVVPSDTVLMEKLKQYRAVTGKRPSAADFM